MRVRLWAPGPSTPPEVAFESSTPGRWVVVTRAFRKTPMTQEDFDRDARSGWPWIDLCVTETQTVNKTISVEETIPVYDRSEERRVGKVCVSDLTPEYL